MNMFRLPIRQQFPNLADVGVVTTPFGGATRYENFHPAVDIAMKKGTPIPSPISGQVVDAVGGKRQGDEGYGNLVTVQTPNGDRHQFGHLQMPAVMPGQQIQKGQLVGTLGNSGGSYSPSGQGDGSHLDYRITDAYRRYKNPTPYIKDFRTVYASRPWQ